MRGVFDDYRDLQPQTAQSHDTELTLSATTLLMLFFGLVLLCGLCFGLGYATGHRGAQEASVILPAASADAAPPTTGNRSKPDADIQSNPASAQPAADTESTSALDAEAATPAGSVASTPAPVGATPLAKPALGGQVNPIQAASPASSTVAP